MTTFMFYLKGLLALVLFCIGYIAGLFISIKENIMFKNRFAYVVLPLALIVLAVVVFSSFPTTQAASAVDMRPAVHHIVYGDPSYVTMYEDAFFPRPDSCRTYWIGGVDSTDGIACAPAVAPKTMPLIDNGDGVFFPKEDNVNNDGGENVNNDGEIINNDNDQDTDDGNTDNGGDGDGDDGDTNNGNNGNHYGNDKPDNNPNDVNNKHNGEQTYDDHHNNGNNKDKDNNGKNK